MKNFNLMASALTISIAAFAVTTAKADCAQDLAAMKTQMGSKADKSSAATPSNDMSSKSGAKSSTAGTAPAVQDQAAASGSDKPYTGKDAPDTMAAKGDSTGKLSGVAPTAAIGEQAKNSNPADSNGSAAKPDGDMAKADGQAMTNLSGTEATKAMGDLAASHSGTSDSGSTNANNGTSTAATEPSSAGAGGMADMAKQHMAAAQLALDSGDEKACMDAVAAMKKSQ